VARCIVREVREGRGSPHGGVFLDIAWIRERISNAPEHIRKKLPSMYHQFKELAGIDITQEAMEVGPTTHYMMGGVRVDPESQMSTVPGLFAAGECAAGLHGANRLGGNSLSDLLVFAPRAGEHAPKFAGASPAPAVDDATLRMAERALDEAIAPFEGPAGGENPYRIQSDLQTTMQDFVGIVRREEEMERAIREVDLLKRRADAVLVGGNRDYNPAWHTALDLKSLLTVSEAIARAALLRRESRGAHFRDDFPDKDKGWGGKNLIVRRGASGAMEIEERPVPELRVDLAQIVEDEAK
jgi:succinate dehydrogenase / fumarate reductase flavoprotein subunit